MSLVRFRPEAPTLTDSESKQFDSDGRRKDAGVAHLVERHLAKVEVASSSLVTRSNSFLVFGSKDKLQQFGELLLATA